MITGNSDKYIRQKRITPNACLISIIIIYRVVNVQYILACATFSFFQQVNIISKYLKFSAKNMNMLSQTQVHLSTVGRRYFPCSIYEHPYGCFGANFALLIIHFPEVTPKAFSTYMFWFFSLKV